MKKYEPGTMITFQDGSYYIIEEYHGSGFWYGCLHDPIWNDEAEEFIGEEKFWRILSEADMQSRGIERIVK